ncbi:hypothetical protein U3516DRAFT_239087 [Neocallimastix sp. 'constans']
MLLSLFLLTIPLFSLCLLLLCRILAWLSFYVTFILSSIFELGISSFFSVNSIFNKY